MKNLFIYTGFLPFNIDSGAEMRLFSNIRTYMDLGFDVEVVYVGKTEPKKWPESLDVTWRYLLIPNRYPSLIDRLAFRLGLPFERVLNFRYTARNIIRKDIRSQENNYFASLYHFEYLFTASAAINLPGVLTIFSSHDLESTRKKIVSEFRGQNRKLSKYDLLNEKYVSLAERLTVKECKLVLTIAAHERAIIRDEWGCDHVELLPMSIPHETMVLRKRDWMADGKLRLFHIGKIDTLLSYNSLKFLCTDVFPRVSKEILQKIEMDVVGKIPETEGAKEVIEMAKKYPQINFLGYKPDIRPHYANADLQVVGATLATGLRTRIIESFAYGVPVISTVIGAQGVDGLNPGENIFLAKDAQYFAYQLTYIATNPECLSRMAVSGRRTYERLYSRPVAAEALSQALERHIFNEKRKKIIHA